MLRADAVASTVLTRKTATAAEVTNTATITGLHALGGLITATALTGLAFATSACGTPAGSACRAAAV